MQQRTEWPRVYIFRNLLLIDQNANISLIILGSGNFFNKIKSTDKLLTSVK